jgi:hypothetical protein
LSIEICYYFRPSAPKPEVSEQPEVEGEAAQPPKRRFRPRPSTEAPVETNPVLLQLAAEAFSEKPGLLSFSSTSHLVNHLSKDTR